MCTPSLAIDVVIETADGSVVLVRRADNGKYATIGGFVNIGESVEATVARELLEETGLALQTGSARLIGVYSDPRRDHRRHTVRGMRLRTKPIVGSSRMPVRRAGFEAESYVQACPASLFSNVSLGERRLRCARG